MAPTSAGSRGAPVLRMLALRVEGERLVLLGEAADRPPGAAVPDALVLRERGSGEEVRIRLSAASVEAPLGAAIDVRALLPEDDVATWDVRVDGAGPAGIEWAVGPGAAPGVVLRRGQDLLRGRVRPSRGGGLAVVVDPLPPHAEVHQVLVEKGELVLDAVLHRGATPPATATVALVARSRQRKVEVEVPAALDGRTVRARLPLRELVTDLPEAEYWDLSVRCEPLGTLRVGAHLDDVADKRTAVVYPAHQVLTPAGGRSLHPYYTSFNNLAVRSRPLPAATSGAAAEEPSGLGAMKEEEGPSLLGRWRHAAARRLAMALARTVVRRLPTRSAAQPVRDGRPHVSILIVHGYGMGGTVRTVVNQATYLRRDHDVEIVSQLRSRREPFFALPPGVGIRPLDDRTEDARLGRFERVLHDRLARLPSLLVHPVDVTYPRCTAWTDVQVVRWLRRQRGGIVMATRPSLNLLIAQLAAPGVLTVGQEHMNFPQHNPALAVTAHRDYRRLDALAVLTDGDLEDYSKVLAGSGTRVVRIPNAVTPLTGGLADPASRLIVAAGRLTNQKGFDRLIPAFEQVVRAHPDWTLRIYGSGPHRARLQALILERGLYNHVRLMGRASSMGEELAKASVYVMSSRFEGFPMVLLEAMSKGLAVVSFDCPRGPADLITSGEDGLLVPNGDVGGLAQGMLRLVEDEELRRRMGAAAVRTAGRYDGEAVGRQWDQLLAALLADRSPSWWRPGTP